MLIPNIEEFEERAAICEHDGGLPRAKAEDLAAQAQGFRDRHHYWEVLAEYVINKRLT